MVWRDIVISYCLLSAILQVLNTYGDGRAAMSLVNAEPGCYPGQWGYQCTEKCHCLLKADQCDHMTGHCDSGCRPGYYGTGCQRLCIDGMFGINCALPCGQCRGGRCNPLTGRCPGGCRTNWTGALCKTYCSNRSSGCPVPCGRCLGGADSCDQTRGVCRGGCMPGWTGLDCNVSCPQGVWGEGCRTVCGRCEGGVNHCDAVRVLCMNGCQQGFSRSACNTEQEDCPGRKCRCGRCYGGSDRCDVITGTCRDGCENNYTGKACMSDCRKNGHEGRCHPRCRNCSCGCDVLTGVCSECGSIYGGAPLQPARPSQEKHKKEKQHWLWIAACASVVSAIVVLLAVELTRRLSIRNRHRHVRDIFNKLTADDSFRFINPPLLNRTRRVKDPQFDLQSLSAKDREHVLRELDCLLEDKEEYEDFVRSPRYRELRVLVANKAWATDSSYVDAFGHEPDSSAAVNNTITRWKLRLSKSLGSSVDVQTNLVEAENGLALQGILKDPDNAEPQTLEDDGGRPIGNNVRFSSAASMIIFPAVNSSSSSVCGVSNQDPCVLNTLSYAWSSLTGSSNVIASPSGVDISCGISSPEPADSPSFSSSAVPNRSSPLGPPVPPVTLVKGHSDTVLYTAQDDTLRFAARDLWSQKRNEKRDISKNALSLCEEGSCCLHICRRTFAHVKDDTRCATIGSESEGNIRQNDLAEQLLSLKNHRLVRATDSLMLLTYPKRDEEGDGVD